MTSVRILQSSDGAKLVQRMIGIVLADSYRDSAWFARSPWPVKGELERWIGSFWRLTQEPACLPQPARRGLPRPGFMAVQPVGTCLPFAHPLPAGGLPHTQGPVPSMPHAYSAPSSGASAHSDEASDMTLPGHLLRQLPHRFALRFGTSLMLD